ncbi:hypothetical protein OGAPHI_001729 [Ogataea philodendri]|uniref:Uncharacterized protein n=1 Tax=Ogataea philodendri TaxID=1378263 RepID=A0A9P8PAG8_9ASCO|nr:uncharacterized protein OGAPHI_001729 [Ogataea philodendri]KAH3667975.1 hypothetical protein OGAPHI_001729 [Ogataea philodendri]
MNRFTSYWKHMSRLSESTTPMKVRRLKISSRRLSTFCSVSCFSSNILLSLTFVRCVPSVKLVSILDCCGRYVEIVDCEKSVLTSLCSLGRLYWLKVGNGRAFLGAELTISWLVATLLGLGNNCWVRNVRETSTFDSTSASFAEMWSTISSSNRNRTSRLVGCTFTSTLVESSSSDRYTNGLWPLGK